MFYLKNLERNMQGNISFYAFMNIYELYSNAEFHFYLHIVYHITYCPKVLKTMVIHCLGFWERHNGKREAPYAAALKTKAVKKKSLFTKIWSFRLSYIFSHSWLHLSLSTQWVLFIKTLGYSLELCLRINNRSVGIPLKFPKGKLQFLNKAREASF